MSIQVKLNGLSFCVLNKSSQKLEHLSSMSFGEKLTPFDVLNRLKDELASNTVFSEEFNSVSVIHYNELASLVPYALYDEALNAEYLKYNSKILKTDFIASDVLKDNQMVSVYVPYININNYIFETFGEFSYTHASTIFIEATGCISEEVDDAVLFVNMENQSMQVLLRRGNSVEFYNYFEFTTPEDFIYYLLFTCEQKHLNPDSIELKFTGDISKEDEFYQIAYKYIRHVSILENSKDFLIKNSFNANNFRTV
ncbi:DUF3822 family protein [Winogradskyella wandonensis]|nr:DUF3822 family protein [Winogradskyella wandonensis]